MSTQDDGGKAFPSAERLQFLRATYINESEKETIYREYAGMSLRDYFAAKAMQGFIESGRFIGIMSCAVDAYKMADAMLEERKQ